VDSSPEISVVFIFVVEGKLREEKTDPSNLKGKTRTNAKKEI
jgi:hypothetical protein